MREQINWERTQLIQAILSAGKDEDEDEGGDRRRRRGRN
jgi:hypothetical protein